MGTDGLPKGGSALGSPAALQLRVGLVRDITAASTATRSEVVAVVWAGVHIAPMMRIMITMISGILRMSTVSFFVGLVDGVLVKLPPVR